MKEFTGYEYILIDIASRYGLDKLTFEERIQWTNDHMDTLEKAAEDVQPWKEKPLYLKAVQALRKVQQGKPTGHLVGLDAVCSGMQLMSVITGCESGALVTGLIDPQVRADAYTSLTQKMIDLLGYHIPGERAKAKSACMKSLYGSKKAPKTEFGDGTPELNAFYQAMYQMAPGACELLEDLLASWQAFTLAHEWRLPDGFFARIKVMQKQECRIEVDELDHTTFTYVYYENEGCERDRKNAANVVHSIDAYVLRSVIRRCNYDPDLLAWAARSIADELLSRELGYSQQERHQEFDDEKLSYYIEQYECSGMADVVILNHLYAETVCALSTTHLQSLSKIVHAMREHKPFPVVTVHDDFKAHPNNLNALRRHYRDVLAELADSQILDDILSQIYGVQGHFPKKSQNLSEKIRSSNYAIC